MTHDQLEVLKPCPFCGGEAELLDGGPGNWFVRCKNCKCSTNDVQRDAAVQLWHRRSALTASPGEQKPVALAHVRLEDDGLFADLQVLDGTNLQPSMSPIALYLSPPPAAGCPDWGQIVQSLLRSMDATVKNEGSRDQAVRMADDLCNKYPALRREAPAPEGVALTVDCAQLLPGGKLDDSTYSKIEDALDKIEAPCQSGDGKWLSLHERIAALASRPDAGGGVREALEDAEDSFEFIRQKLINNLEEPERSAFWRAVNARERCRAALSTPSAAAESNASVEAIELAYGLLWVIGCDRSTRGGNALYLARKALFEQLDRVGQGRGISAARKAINDETATFGSRYSRSANASVEARLRPTDCANPMQCGWHHVCTEPEIGLWVCSQPGCNHMTKALSAVGDEAKKSEGRSESSLPEGESDLSVTTGCRPSDPTAERREIVVLRELRDWVDTFFDRRKLKSPERELMERADAILAALDGGAGA